MNKRFRLPFYPGFLLMVIAPLAIGQQPVVTLSATSLKFGTLEAESTSPVQVVTLTNTGNAVLTITELSAAKGYHLFNDGCTTVAAGDSCTFGVVFQPTTAGSYPSAVTIADNAANSPQRVGLSGTATAPIVGLSPNALSFGLQAVGSTSAVQNVTLTNEGTSTLTINSITASGDFAQTNMCPGSLASGANCMISITFSPTTGGARGGSVTINSAGNSPQNVSLIGTASSGTASLSPTTVTFAKQNIWTSSSAQTVTLTNTGNTPLEIISVVASGDYAQTNNCDSSLATSASCSINVSFQPSGGGTRTGYITVSDTDASSLQTISLTGTGRVPVTAVTITPGFASARSTQTVQFQAFINGVASSNVTWAVDGINGGNSTVGTITSAGVYTSPSVAGTHTVQATNNANKAQSAISRVVATAFPGMYTNHNDNSRTGQNLNEVVLSTGNVNGIQFGKLFSYPVDGYVYAQPLYVPDLVIPGQGTHNVVIVATEHDSVYAFDANNSPSTPLWHVSFIDPGNGVTTVPSADVDEAGCQSSASIGVEVGITGTPVIDPTANQLFVVVRTKENGTYVQRLHAIDITTGNEVSGSPVVIQASVQGIGEGSYGSGTVAFNSLLENSRPGLLLMNGVVYIVFSSLCDKHPYHGWVLGYDESTLAQVSMLNTSPNGSATGIWQSGNGIVGEASTGYIYLSTGNGWFDVNGGGVDYGDTVMKLSTTGNALGVVDYFTPHNQDTLDFNDLDMGSGGCLLLPDQPTPPIHLLTCVGKEGNVYLLNRDNMGQFNPSGDTQILESLMIGMAWSSPAYWLNQTYFWGQTDVLRAYRLYGSLLSATPVSLGTKTSLNPPPTPTVSANGATNGIVWAVITSAFKTGGPAILRAYDAANVSRQIFSSSAIAANTAGPAVKFVVPTVADGQVFVGTQSEVDVYGILPP